MKFAVLLSVYYKESPQALNEALCSIYDEQALKPNQIVLVQDGALTPELDAVITVWQSRLGEIFTAVPLAKNVGLAMALNEGLKHCSYDLVARMDTDDMSLPERFAKQVSFMAANPDVAVSSGLIEEWSEDFAYKISERKLPLAHSEIFRFAKARNPISHPAVIFRKSAVMKCGGYPAIYPEDYPLWGKMLHQGFVFANLPDCLLKMRVGNALTQRRGKAFLKGEIQLFRYLNAIGFLSQYEMYRNIVQRSLVRLAPTWIKTILYKMAR